MAGGGDWQDDLASKRQRYRDSYLGGGVIAKVESDFRAAVDDGDVRLPMQVLLRCRFEHPLVAGQLLLSNTSGRIFFVPDLDFIDYPRNGVYVWRNGDPTAAGTAGTLWSTLRIRLTCAEPSCDYSPQVYWDAINAWVMQAALDGDLHPILDI
jgi:hypothetical protein